MASARKRGNSWRMRIYVGKDEKTGKEFFRSVTAPTKRECEQLAAKVRIEYQNRNDPTFSEAIQRYIETRTNSLSPSTISGYEKIARNHISSIKDIRLSRLTSEDIQRQLDELAAGHSPKTVNNARSLFVSVLRVYSPELKLNLSTPAKEKKEKTIPTDTELQQLLTSSSDEYMTLAMMLAAFGSLRESEVSGLFPDCVNEDSISIRRTMVEKSGGGFVIKDHPKSFAGYRTITPPKYIMDKLHQLTREADQPIIPYNPSQIRSRFETIRKRAGLEKISFHALRHYFATYCHSQNIPDKAIAKIGGWENIETLQKIYQHSTIQREEELSNIVAAHFENLTKNLTMQ